MTATATITAPVAAAAAAVAVAAAAFPSLLRLVLSAERRDVGQWGIGNTARRRMPNGGGVTYLRPPSRPASVRHSSAHSLPKGAQA